MNNAKIVYTNNTAEEVQGVVGFNAGNTAVQFTTYTGEATILVLEAAKVERIVMTPITEDNMSEQPQEFQDWYQKQLEGAVQEVVAKQAEEPVH